MFSYYTSLCSEFRVVMSVTISTYNYVRFVLYLQLFEGWFMPYLRYVCLFAHSGVQYILCCGFVWFFFFLCTLCFSGLSFFDAPLLFSNVYLRRVSHVDQELLAILKYLIAWGSCYSLFSFLCNVCPFLLDLSVSDCPICIFKLCLSL